MEKPPAKPKKEGPGHPAKVQPVDESLRGIVRIAGKDVQGHVPLRHALLRIRGIGSGLGPAVASVLHQELGLSPALPVGKLNDEQVEKIDNILFHISSYKIPGYLFNRRADVLDGTQRHVIMNDLLFSLKQDVEREKKLYTWRGYRHAYGQKVRGQRTRNTGRTGMAVGVLRKAVLAAQKAAAAPEARGGKPVAGAAAPAAAAPAAGKPAGASAGKPAAAPAAAAKPVAKKPEAK